MPFDESKKVTYKILFAASYFYNEGTILEIEVAFAELYNKFGDHIRNMVKGTGVMDDEHLSPITQTNMQGSYLAVMELDVLLDIPDDGQGERLDCRPRVRPLTEEEKRCFSLGKRLFLSVPDAAGNHPGLRANPVRALKACPRFTVSNDKHKKKA